MDSNSTSESDDNDEIPAESKSVESEKRRLDLDQVPPTSPQPQCFHFHSGFVPDDQSVTRGYDKSEVSCPSKRQRTQSVDEDVSLAESSYPICVSNTSRNNEALKEELKSQSSGVETDEYGEIIICPISSTSVQYPPPSISSTHAIAENFRRNEKEKNTFSFGQQQAKDFSRIVFNFDIPSGARSTPCSDQRGKVSSKMALLQNLSAGLDLLECQKSQLNIDTLNDTSEISASEGQTTVENINELPVHILIDVFKQLSMNTLLLTVSLVCKMWYHLARDPGLWRHISLQFQHKVDDRILWYLTSLSDRVSYLNLADTKLISSDCLSLVAEKCHYLHTINLTRCFNVSSDVLESIGKSCHQLLNLQIDGCYKVSDEGLVHISEGCPRLKCLQLSRCNNVTDKGLCAITSKCHQLQQITMEHCYKVTDTAVMSLAEGCPDLVYLSLMSTMVTDCCVSYIKKMSKITFLDVSGNLNLISSSVSSITQFLWHLECLNLSLDTQMDDDCILEIVRCGNHLKRLYCVACAVTDVALIKIGEYTKTLAILDIGWCSKVTDVGVRSISANCSTLKHLGLIRCDLVTTETVEELVHTYPHINYSTFILESKILIEKARLAGFKFDDANSEEKHNMGSGQS